jgi:hypothetical protein
VPASAPFHGHQLYTDTVQDLRPVAQLPIQVDFLVHRGKNPVGVPGPVFIKKLLRPQPKRNRREDVKKQKKDCPKPAA